MIRWERILEFERHLKAKDYPNHFFGETEEEMKKLEKNLYNPAKILCFFADIDGDMNVVLETCAFDHQDDTVFTSVWTKAYTGRGAERTSFITSQYVHTIVRHCLTIPWSEDGDKLIQVWPRELWADHFFYVGSIIF